MRDLSQEMNDCIRLVLPGPIDSCLLQWNGSASHHLIKHWPMYVHSTIHIFVTEAIPSLIRAAKTHEFFRERFGSERLHLGTLGTLLVIPAWFCTYSLSIALITQLPTLPKSPPAILENHMIFLMALMYIYHLWSGSSIGSGSPLGAQASYTLKFLSLGTKLTQPITPYDHYMLSHSLYIACRLPGFFALTTPAFSESKLFSSPSSSYSSLNQHFK